MKTVILVRHGQSATNLQKVFTGQLDAPLTELGKEQAEKMSAFVCKWPVEKIYVSSLSRAVETALPIVNKLGCPMEKSDAFREIDAGAWQGRTFEEIAGLFPKSYAVWRSNIADAHPEEGESCRYLYDRVIKAFTHILQNTPESTVCIVAHATPIRMIESYICAGGPEMSQDISWVPNASVTIYGYDGEFHLIKRGECGYLGDKLTNLPKNI